MLLKYVKYAKKSPHGITKDPWLHLKVDIIWRFWQQLKPVLRGLVGGGGGSVRIWPTTWDKASSPGYESHHVLNLRQNSLNLLWFHIVPYQVGAISGTWFPGPCLKGRVRNTHAAASWSSHTLWLHVPWWRDACCIIILPLLIIDCSQPEFLHRGSWAISLPLPALHLHCLRHSVSLCARSYIMLQLFTIAFSYFNKEWIGHPNIVERNVFHLGLTYVLSQKLQHCATPNNKRPLVITNNVVGKGDLSDRAHSTCVM